MTQEYKDRRNLEPMPDLHAMINREKDSKDQKDHEKRRAERLQDVLAVDDQGGQDRRTSGGNIASADSGNRLRSRHYWREGEDRRNRDERCGRQALSKFGVHF